MDAATVALIIGVVSLLIERTFAWAYKIKKSKCFGNEIKMNNPA